MLEPDASKLTVVPAATLLLLAVMAAPGAGSGVIATPAGRKPPVIRVGSNAPVEMLNGSSAPAVVLGTQAVWPSGSTATEVLARDPVGRSTARELLAWNPFGKWTDRTVVDCRSIAEMRP